MSRKFTIGRERGCDVLIHDESVSRVHAEIWLGDDGKIMIADRGSSNGTALLRGSGSAPLTYGSVQHGDQVRFGSVTLDVKDLIESVELKNPGALTPRAGPPPLPPPPPVPKAGPPPLPPPPALPRQGAALVRCECGAIKTVGQVCPGCHR
ncbi:MAG TPA: FHA domain-containing protein [Bryobacteraceae bacterium]|nr:FHA domain-containing protein [Bryobacteraceae bacterium]